MIVMTFGRKTTLLMLALLLSACAGLRKPIPEPLPDLASQTEARRLLSALNTANTDLKTFKGIGNIKVQDGSQVQMTRMAWLGAEPANLRIELLGFGGQPMASLASDGDWYYLASHSPKRFHKDRASSAGFKRFIALPVKADAIIALLTGRVPVAPHRYAGIAAGTDGYVITLLNKRGNIQERIYLDRLKQTFEKIEIYDESGSLAYRAERDLVRSVDGYRVPFRLVISNDDDVSVQLEVDRYWANVPVEPAAFILTPP